MTTGSALQQETGPEGRAALRRSVRDDFPALFQKVHGEDLVYLDSAATSLKPRVVIDAVREVFERDCANVHRGVHLLSQRASASYENARKTAARFLNAGSEDEIVFTAGTTAAINLVAQSWARPRLKTGDKILITGLEHHSNIVPWQVVCQQTGATLDWVPINDAGEVPLEEIEKRIDSSVLLVAMNHASNSLGSVQPVEEVARLAHQAGAKLLLDGAQAAPHLPLDVRAIGCDFYAFSGHKVYGPTGVGVLYGRRALLEEAEPYQVGGGMIRSVTFEETRYADLPDKFDAGTPNIAGVVGLGAALEYVETLGRDWIEEREQALLAYGTDALSSVPGVKLIGTAKRKIGVLAFVMDCAHPHDIGTIVDNHGVAIRTGHHCTQPVMERYGVPATARASLGVYNTKADIDALTAALEAVRKMFA